MKQGFVKVAAVTPDMRVADVEYNTEEICKNIDEAVKEGAKVIVFPELSITGYTCGDLFFQEALLNSAEEGLRRIAAYTKGKDALVFVISSRDRQRQIWGNFMEERFRSDHRFCLSAGKKKT